MKQILTKKAGMTQIIKGNGEIVPVTVLVVGECQVTQVKTDLKDGYNAIQIGMGKLSEKKINKPSKGHFKAAGNCYRYLREIRVDNIESINTGDYLSINMFEVGEKVDARGLSIGKGYQGTIKRWNFHRGPMSHGSKSHRIPGSIGGHTEPGHVFKGKKMAGHMGNNQVTVRNLEIVEIDEENQVILVKGTVPGSKNNIIELRTTGEMKFTNKMEEAADKSIVEQANTEKEEAIKKVEGTLKSDNDQNAYKNEAENMSENQSDPEKKAEESK